LKRLHAKVHEAVDNPARSRGCRTEATSLPTKTSPSLNATCVVPVVTFVYLPASSMAHTQHKEPSQHDGPHCRKSFRILSSTSIGAISTGGGYVHVRYATCHVRRNQIWFRWIRTRRYLLHGSLEIAFERRFERTVRVAAIEPPDSLVTERESRWIVRMASHSHVIFFGRWE
jgi:hypothetical protein